MTCCHHQGLEQEFNESVAQADLARYRRRGPARETRLLLARILDYGVEGLTLLDIGGGVGVIQHELLARGASAAIHVDASQAYLRASQQEAERRGYGARVQRYHGDFVALAGDIPAADIVTLDRVVCCYPDMPSLVRASLGRAKRLYGLVYPRDTWWIRGVRWLINGFMRLRGSHFRFFVHSRAALEDILTENGWQTVYYRRTLIWQIVLFARADARPSSAKV
jgi:magnesium-protoporphyrin O-methyltransferase